MFNFRKLLTMIGKLIEERKKTIRFAPLNFIYRKVNNSLATNGSQASYATHIFALFQICSLKLYQDMTLNHSSIMID